MKMNRNELETLYAFRFPNLKATVQRLRMVAAPLHPIQRRRSCFICFYPT